MSVTLGGVPLNSSLVLESVENSPDFAYSTQRTIGGNLAIQTSSLNGGRVFMLTTKSTGSLMGMWCQSQIDQLKTIAAAQFPVTLDHPRGVFNVLIAEFDVEPFDDREPISPVKQYTGGVKLIEV